MAGSDFSPARLLAGAVVGLSCLHAPQSVLAQQVAAASEQARYEFNIDAQPVLAALGRFSAITGIAVLRADQSAIEGRAAAVSGNLTSEQALQRLLTGTGLGYRVVDAGTVELVDLPPPATGDAPGAMTLDRLDVNAEAIRGRPEDLNFTRAGSQVYLSEERIQRFRGSSVGDFLKGEPGVLTGDNRNSGAVDINIRGMQGFGRVPVLVDGSQQQNTVYRGYSGAASRNYIDPDMIGSVTIEKGPTSGVDGVGATGGVARMQTLNPQDILLDGKDFGLRVRGGLMGNTTSPPAANSKGGTYGQGSYTTGCNWGCTLETVPDFYAYTNTDRPDDHEFNSASGSIAMAKRWSMGEVLGVYSRRRNGNYYAGERGGRQPSFSSRVVTTDRNGRETETTTVTFDGLNRYVAGEEVLNTSQNNTSYLLKGRLWLADEHQLTASYMNYQSEFGELMPSVIIRFDGAVQAPMSEVEVDTYTLNYNWKPLDNDWIDLDANLWRTKTDTRIVTPYSFFGIDFPQGYWDLAKRTGTDISNTSRLHGKLGELSLNYGGSYVYETLEPGGDTSELYTGFGDGLEARDGWRKEYSGFISGEWKPWQWLTLNASVRYTDTESHDRNAVRVATGVYEYNVDRNSGFAPIYSITVEPLAGWQLYAKYAEAIRSPSLFESTTGWSFSSAPRLDLQPERARNLELGSNLALDSLLVDGDQARAKVAYFENRVNNYLTRSIGNWDSFNGTTVRNIHHAVFRGVEASIGYDNGLVFGQASGIHYDKILFCKTQDDCRPGGVQNGYAQLHVPPKYSASLTLGTRLFQQRLTLGGRISREGERPAENNNADSGGYTTLAVWDPYTLIDVFASYEHSDHLTVDLNIDNLRDQYYMDVLNLGLMPSPGRTVRASLTYNF